MTEYKYIDINKITEHDLNIISIKNCSNTNSEFYNYLYDNKLLILKTDWITSDKIKIESWQNQNKINYIKLLDNWEAVQGNIKYFNNYDNFNFVNKENNLNKIIVKGGSELGKLGKNNECYEFKSLSFRFDYENPKYFLIGNIITDIDHNTKDGGIYKEKKFLSEKFKCYPKCYKDMKNLIKNGGKFKFTFMPIITKTENMYTENNYVIFMKLIGIIVDYNEKFKFIKGAPKFIIKSEKKELTKEEYIKQKQEKINYSNKKIIDILLHE